VSAVPTAQSFERAEVSTPTCLWVPTIMCTMGTPPCCHCCSPPADTSGPWMPGGLHSERLRLAQEALLLLKDLVTGPYMQETRESRGGGGYCTACWVLL
jgi:hypothetical protein